MVGHPGQNNLSRALTLALFTLSDAGEGANSGGYADPNSGRGEGANATLGAGAGALS